MILGIGITTVFGLLLTLLGVVFCAHSALASQLAWALTILFIVLCIGFTSLFFKTQFEMKTFYLTKMFQDGEQKLRLGINESDRGRERA